MTRVLSHSTSPHYMWPPCVPRTYSQRDANVCSGRSNKGIYIWGDCLSVKTGNCRMESNRESHSAYGSYYSKLDKDSIRKEEAHTHLAPALCQTLAPHRSYLHLQLLTEYHLTFTKQKLKSKETERINTHCPARKCRSELWPRPLFSFELSFLLQYFHGGGH